MTTLLESAARVPEKAPLLPSSFTNSCTDTMGVGKGDIRTMGKVKVVNIVRADMRIQREGKGRQYSKYHNIGYISHVYRG